MENSYKLTEKRQAVLDLLIKNKGKHLSAEDVYKLMKSERPEIGLATVYRALPLLEKMGLVSKADLDDDCMRYEYRDPSRKPHSHLICLQCGSVSEVQADVTGALEAEIYNKNTFLVKNYSAKIYGYCHECQKAASKKKTRT
jgi:Fur family ferric uptake transcriptional regulator